MMRALVVMLVLAGCATPAEGPRANAVVRVTPDGVRVQPVISGSVGGVGVVVAP